MNLRKTFLVLLASAMLASAADPAVELEAAIRRETVQGDLKGAAESYRRIAANTGADRNVVARALLRLAMVYRKQGDVLARQTLDRLVRDFSDQARIVAEARVELARIAPAKAKETVAIRQLWKGEDVSPESVSADGALATFSDRRTANLGVLDLRTSAMRMLTDYGNWNQLKGAVNVNRISPDGNWVAFHANLRAGGELRVIRTDGTQTKVLHQGKKNDRIWPHAWTPDSRHLLGLHSFQDANGTWHEEFVQIATSSGEMRTVKTDIGQTGPSLRLSVSPDGRWLAYSSGLLPLRVISMDGKGEVRHEAERPSERTIGWSPDSKHLIVASNRTGAPGIWRLPMNEGRAVGSPELIRSLPSMPLAAGFDAKGTFYYTERQPLSNAYTMGIDTAAGQASSEPRRVTNQYEDHNVGPLWSPDGRELTWFAVGTAGKLKELVVRDLASGSERTVVMPVSVGYNPSPSWLTGGQGVMVSTAGLDRQGTIYRINPATGGSTKVLSHTANPNSPFEQSWSADGSKAYRVERAAIIEIDTATLQEREVYRDSAGYVRDVAVSPDGKSLAYVAHQAAPSNQPGLYGPVHIKIVEPASGKARELVEVRPAWHRRMMTWTPDGKHLIYATEMYAGNDQPTRLWLVPAAGGTPVQLGKDFGGRVFGLVVSPDGKHLGFDVMKEVTELSAIEGLFAR